MVSHAFAIGQIELKDLQYPDGRLINEDQELQSLPTAVSPNSFMITAIR